MALHLEYRGALGTTGGGGEAESSFANVGQIRDDPVITRGRIHGHERRLFPHNSIGLTRQEFHGQAIDCIFILPIPPLFSDEICVLSLRTKAVSSRLP